MSYPVVLCGLSAADVSVDAPSGEKPPSQPSPGRIGGRERTREEVEAFLEQSGFCMTWWFPRSPSYGSGSSTKIILFPPKYASSNYRVLFYI